MSSGPGPSSPSVAVVVVAVPLGFGSWQVVQEQVLISRAQPVAREWAERAGWEVTEVGVSHGRLHVAAIGLPPEASQETLRAALDDAGLADVDVSVKLVLGASRVVEADDGG